MKIHGRQIIGGLEKQTFFLYFTRVTEIRKQYRNIHVGGMFVLHENTLVPQLADVELNKTLDSG